MVTLVTQISISYICNCYNFTLHLSSSLSNYKTCCGNRFHSVPALHACQNGCCSCICLSLLSHKQLALRTCSDRNAMAWSATTHHSMSCCVSAASSVLTRTNKSNCNFRDGSMQMLRALKDSMNAQRRLNKRHVENVKVSQQGACCCDCFVSLRCTACPAAVFQACQHTYDCVHYVVFLMQAVCRSSYTYAFSSCHATIVILI